MKHRLAIISVLLISFLAACGGQVKKDDKAGDEMWGKETGYATIFDEDVALARDRAIDDAMNKLVKVKLGTLVSGYSMVQDYALVESIVEVRSSGMVKDWKVVEERRDGTTFIATIQGRVYPQAVNDTIQATLENYGRPKFMMLINEVFNGKQNTPGMTVTELAAMNIMGNLGFEFVDAATVQNLIAEDSAAMKKAAKGSVEVDGSAQKLLANAGAEVIIVGDVKTVDQSETIQKLAPGTDMKSFRATVNLKAIDVYTGAILASVTSDAPGANIAADAACKLAVQTVLAKKDVLGKDKQNTGAFINDITKKFLAAATKRQIKLNISGLEYAEVTKFRNQIAERVRGVSKVIPKGTSGSSAVLEILFAGKSTDFADELIAKSSNMGFEVKIVESFPSKINMNVKYLKK